MRIRRTIAVTLTAVGIRTVVIFAAIAASIAVADDFKTIEGREYKNAEVNRVEPDGIMLKTKSGLTKVYFNELPKEVQDRFHYEPQQAAQYFAQTVEQIRITQRQKIEQDQKRADEIARNLAIVRQQQEAEAQRQQRLAELQLQQQQPQQRQRGQTRATYGQSQEGMPEHLYELTQDYKIVYAGATIRFKRGQQFRGRILVDHAEIDSGGVSYNVSPGILRKVD